MFTGLFNPASVSALVSAVVSGIAAGCNFTATLEAPLQVYLWTGRIQVLMVALHVLAWHRYLPGWSRQPSGTAHRRSLWALAAAGLVALVPGAVYGEAVVTRPLAWLGVSYHDPAVEVRVPPGLHVQGQADALVQVLTNLASPG